jgi:uncharacterized protein YxjI
LKPPSASQPGYAAPSSNHTLPQLPLDRFKERIGRADSLVIQQVAEMNEVVLGVESRNKYKIKDGDTMVGYAAEQGSDVGSILMRQFLGHWRTFSVHVFDAMRQPLLVATHPFRWFLQRLDISDASGNYLGAIQQRFAFFHRKFDVLGPQGTVLASVSTPFWRPWTFGFVRGARELAVLRKKFPGVLEMVTDKDTFQIDFTEPRLDEHVRLLLLMAALLVDLAYFEKQGGG